MALRAHASRPDPLVASPRLADRSAPPARSGHGRSGAPGHAALDAPGASRSSGPQWPCARSHPESRWLGGGVGPQRHHPPSPQGPLESAQGAGHAAVGRAAVQRHPGQSRRPGQAPLALPWTGAPGRTPSHGVGPATHPSMGPCFRVHPPWSTTSGDGSICTRCPALAPLTPPCEMPYTAMHAFLQAHRTLPHVWHPGRTPHPRR